MDGPRKSVVRIAATNSQIEELSCDIVDGEAFLIAMADRFGQYGTSSRSAITRAEDANDVVTADLFTEITREVNESLYFLESHLQG